MSLHYVIDGCNIIHHPAFKQILNKKPKDLRTCLVDLIRAEKLCGSPRNTASIIFDGHPPQHLDFHSSAKNTRVIFSKEESADEVIKRLVEDSSQPRNNVVVSDDKEVKLLARLNGARALGAQEFLGPPRERRIERQEAQDLELKPELTYSQMHRINEELRSVWLKEE